MVNMKLAVASDKDFISKVCLDASKKYDSIMPGAFEKQALKYKKNGLPSTYQMWVIRNDSDQIGFFADKELSEKVVYVVGLYILSGFQNLGFGKIVLETFEKKCKKEKILLLVHQNAEWAINFYKKNGYSIVGKTKEEIIGYEELMTPNYIPSTYLMSKNII